MVSVGDQQSAVSKMAVNRLNYDFCDYVIFMIRKGNYANC